MTVYQIIEGKEREGGKTDVITVTADSAVVDAISTMSKHRIGAVLVTEGDKVAGILSERDVMHLIGKGGPEALDSKVSGCMTRDPVRASRSDTIDKAMAVMTEGRFRHLPVYDGDELLGMISIGDVVKRKIEQAEHEVENLKGYISS